VLIVLAIPLGSWRIPSALPFFALKFLIHYCIAPFCIGTVWGIPTLTVSKKITY